MRAPLSTIRDAIVPTYPPGAARTCWLRTPCRLALDDRRTRRRGGDPRDHDLILQLIAGEMARDVRLSGPRVCGSSNSVDVKGGSNDLDGA